MNNDFQLRRNSFGQLVLTGQDGREHVDVEPARAFPINARFEAISLLSSEGHELVWIPKLEDLPTASRRLVEEELAVREFMPEIRRVSNVSDYVTPCTWQVETDRGDTSLLLDAEEDIRRLPGTALLVVDNRGIQFLIRNPLDLDANSRRILDHFL